MLFGSCTALWSGLFPGAAMIAGAAALLILAAACRRPFWAAVGLGLLLSSSLARHELACRWPPERDAERELLRLRVASVPVVERGGIAFDAEVIGGGAAIGRVRVRWNTVPLPLSRWPRAGEQWQLLLRLAAPRATRNPGAPDRERQLFRDRIHALAAVVPSRLNLRLGPARPGLLPLRESIVQLIQLRVADRDAAALIAALAVGVTGQLSAEQWRVFNATGTTHLVAISGMHVTLFAWICAGGARRLWSRWPGRPRLLRDSVAAAAGICAAVAYAMLAGFEVPAQRTCVMLTIWWLVRLSERRITASATIGIALGAVLLLDPLAPLSVGFWLSFVAVAALLALGPLTIAAKRRESRLAALWQRLGAATAGQWMLGLCLAPLTLAVFGSLSVAGALVNLAAIPLFSFALVPVILLATVSLHLAAPLAALCLQLARQLHDVAWPLLRWAADWPGAQWFASPSALWFICAAVLLPALLLPLAPRVRLLSALLAVPLLFSGPEPPRQGHWRAQVLDAGDGSAVLLQTRRHTLVYDTGDLYGSRGAFALGTALPALRASRASRVDLLLISRANAYRIAGAAQLLSAGSVAAVYSGGEWAGSPPGVQRCPEHKAWTWDGVELRLYAPRIPLAPGISETGACALRVRAAGGRLLLANQLDQLQLEVLLSARVALDADVAVAPRAGSLAGSPPRLVQAVRPAALVVSRRAISAASRQRLAQRWQLAADQIYITGERGALQIASSDAGPQLRRLVDRFIEPIWRVSPALPQP